MKSRVEARCTTCSGLFKRRWSRQRKCGRCRYANVYKCATCRVPYERGDDVRVCPSCLARLQPPTGEDAREWDRHLALIGNGTSRGASIGPTAIAYEHELLPPESEGPPLENIQSEDPSRHLIAYSDAQLLDFFVSGSAHEVGRAFGLHHWQVQRIRAEIFGIETSEVEAAKAVLGWDAESWTRHKLGAAIIRARAEVMREELRKAA